MMKQTTNKNFIEFKTCKCNSLFYCLNKYSTTELASIVLLSLSFHGNKHITGCLPSQGKVRDVGCA